MSIASVQTTTAVHSPSGLPADLVTNFFIGLAVFLGGFVLFEPAPYEIVLAAMIVIGLSFGMRIPRDMLPVLIPVTTFAIGGLISAFQIDDYNRGLIYNAVTFFLGLTTIFFAIMIKNDMARLRLIFRLYVIAAVVSSLLGILGYFGLPGLEIFTRFGRAQGVFADPNVFAPFIVPPILYLMYGVMNRSITKLPIRLGLLSILLLAELLAFSRAGWGLTALSMGLFYFLLLVNERDMRIRAKYILFGLFGFTALIIALLIALQIEAIAEIFVQRAQVVQDYDGARFGRFARHAIGFELATQKPLGIGTLEFGFLYGEDEHNVYMRSLLTYGWLGFASWLMIIGLPLAYGFKLLFKTRPWQIYFQVAYVVFVGHLLVGWIIDIDHWRHFYLLMGIIWGCIMLERQQGREYIK